MSSHLSPVGILQFRTIRDPMAKATTNRATLQDTALYNPWILYGLQERWDPVANTSASHTLR